MDPLPVFEIPCLPDVFKKGNIEMSHYVHTVPGRMRIKIPELRRRSTKAREVEQLLCHHQGIEYVRIKALTGSVVVHYDPDLITPDEILNILKYGNYFDETRMIPYEAHLNQSTHQAGQALGRAAVSWAVGRALEGSGLGFLAALI